MVFTFVAPGREEVHDPRGLERDPVLGQGEVQLLHEALLRQHAVALHPRLGSGKGQFHDYLIRRVGLRCLSFLPLSVFSEGFSQMGMF